MSATTYALPNCGAIVDEFFRDGMPAHQSGRPLWWSVMVKRPGGETHRLWVSADAKGLALLEDLRTDDLTEALYRSQGLYLFPSRSAAGEKVACHTHAWVDLDIYNATLPGWVEMDDAERAQIILDEIRAQGLPEPSEIWSSGRGLYVFWRLAQPLWRGGEGGSLIERLNRQLVSRLKALGADASATDAARVLRVPGSWNSKPGGGRVRPIWVRGPVYSLTDLMAAVLPDGEPPAPHKPKPKLEPANDFDAVRASAARRMAQPMGEGAADKRAGHFNPRAYAATLINDLRTLAQRRWGGEVREGMRDIFGHLAVSAVAAYASPETLLSETAELIGDFMPADYMEREFAGHNGPSVRKLAAARARRSNSEPDYDPDARYAYGTRRMVELLKITPDEMTELATLVDSATKAEWRRKAKEAKRREAGMIPRNQYEQNGLVNRKPWLVEGVSRRTWYRRKEAERAVGYAQMAAKNKKEQQHKW